MKHTHKKTNLNIFAKKNILTLITYGIAACVILSCAAAAVIGITGNNKSSSKAPSEDGRTSSLAESAGDHTEQPASVNGYNESGEYTPADSETDKNTDSDHNAKPDNNTDSDNNTVPDNNTDSDNNTVPYNNTDSDNNTVPDNNTDSDNNTVPDYNDDLEADYEIPFSLFE